MSMGCTCLAYVSKKYSFIDTFCWCVDVVDMRWGCVKKVGFLRHILLTYTAITRYHLAFQFMQVRVQVPQFNECDIWAAGKGSFGRMRQRCVLRAYAH